MEGISWILGALRRFSRAAVGERGNMVSSPQCVFSLRVACIVLWARMHDQRARTPQGATWIKHVDLLS